MKAWLLAIPAALILLGTGGYLAFKHYQAPKPTVLSESDAQREQAIQQAYHSPSDNSSPRRALIEHSESCGEFFTQLQQAFANKHKERLTKLVSATRMFDFCKSSGLVEFDSQKQSNQVRKGFKIGLGNGLVQSSDLMAYDEFDILHIDEITPNEVIAYVRMWHDELEVYTKMRWWLIKGQDQAWVAYDYEDLDSGMVV